MDLEWHQHREAADAPPRERRAEQTKSKYPGAGFRLNGERCAAAARHLAARPPETGTHERAAAPVASSGLLALLARQPEARSGALN